MENEADERLGIRVGRYSLVSLNGEWRMRLMSEWYSVFGVIRLNRETENGE